MTEDLARVVFAARTPHGYTLATWGAGVLYIDRYGIPDLGGALLFVAGATSVFGVILWTVRSRQESAPAPRLPLAGVHLGALSASTFTAWSVAALVPAPWGWCAASAISTIAFFVLHSAQDWAAAEREQQRGSSVGLKGASGERTRTQNATSRS